MKNFLFAFLACGFILASCGGDDCTSENVAADITSIGEAAEDFSTDTTKCADYRDALQDFVDKYDGCDLAGVSQSVTSYQAAIDGLDCN